MIIYWRDIDTFLNSVQVIEKRKYRKKKAVPVVISDNNGGLMALANFCIKNLSDIGVSCDKIVVGIESASDKEALTWNLR